MTTSWPTMAAQEDDAETTATQVAEAIVRAEEARLARAQRMTPEEVSVLSEQSVKRRSVEKTPQEGTRQRDSKIQR